MLTALRTQDDPGLAPRLLAASNAIDRSLRTRPRWLCLRPVCLGEAAVLALVTAVIVGLLVATT